MSSPAVALAAAALPGPRHCFCQIPLREMRGWARRKYFEGVSTMDLFQVAHTPREKHIVGLVALLDLPDDDVVRLLADRSTPDCNVLACRDHVKAWLRDTLSHRPTEETLP